MVPIDTSYSGCFVFDVVMLNKKLLALFALPNILAMIGFNNPVYAKAHNVTTKSIANTNINTQPFLHHGVDVVCLVVLLSSINCESLE